MGGSSSVGGPKISKLAALAAARKKKENDNPSGGTTRSATNSVALLDKLSGKMSATKIGDECQLKRKASSLENRSSENPAKTQDRKYPVRDSRNSTPSIQKEESGGGPKVSEGLPESFAAVVAVPAAAPSIFARTIFGSSQETRKIPVNLSEPSIFFALPMFVPNTEIDPFAGPSPDDIVIKAQNSKGSTQKIREV